MVSMTVLCLVDVYHPHPLHENGVKGGHFVIACDARRLCWTLLQLGRWGDENERTEDEKQNIIFR